MDNTTHIKSYGFKREKLLPYMEKNGYDFVLLTSPENVFYTTGLPCLPVSGQPMIYNLRWNLPFCSIIDKTGKVTLLCWNYATDLVTMDDVDELITLRTYDEFLAIADKYYSEHFKEGDTVGVESVCPSFITNLLAKTKAKISPVYVDEAMVSVRIIKSEAELAKIRKGTEIVGKTIEETKQIIHLGMDRSDLLTEARWRMCKYGATGISHLTCAFGATNPEIDFHENLEKDKLITVDFGAFCEGYASDNRRYVYTGTVPNELRELHKTMVYIVDTIATQLTVGKKLSEVYQFAVELSKSLNIVLAYSHIGHSMGLATEELRIDAKADVIIEENMALNIELFTKYHGQSVGNEETYITHKDGPERITPWTREIFEVK